MAVAENGGRSAPQSAAGRAGGLTPIDAWRDMFPKAPTGYSNGRAPRISARDAAIAASQPEYLPGTGPLNIPRNLTGSKGNATTDATNLALNMQIARNPRSVISARGNPMAPGASAAAPIPSRVPAPQAPMRFAQDDPRRAALHEARPDVFIAGTPANLAFTAHAKEFGEESAHNNINDILPPLDPLEGEQAPQSANYVPGKPAGWTPPISAYNG